MLLTVISPDEFVGDILNELIPSGKIEVMRRDNEYQEILADVPLRTFRICYRIRSLSQEELLTLEFKKYDICPEQVQNTVLKKIRGMWNKCLTKKEIKKCLK